MNLSWTIYLPSLKLLGQRVLVLSVAQCAGYRHDLWSLPLTYWPEYQQRSLKLLVQISLALSVSQGLETIMTSDLCPSYLTFNRDHLLITEYLPTKFEASRAMRSWVISCTMLRDTDIPTDRHVQSNMPLLLRRGHNNLDLNLIYIKKEDLKWMVEEFKKSPDDLFEDQLNGYKHEEFSSALHPIGTRVRRGPTWQYKNQDGGGPGTVVGQQRAKHELGKMTRMTTI